MCCLVQLQAASTTEKKHLRIAFIQFYRRERTPQTAGVRRAR